GRPCGGGTAHDADELCRVCRDAGSEPLRPPDRDTGRSPLTRTHARSRGCHRPGASPGRHQPGPAGAEPIAACLVRYPSDHRRPHRDRTKLGAAQRGPGASTEGWLVSRTLVVTNDFPTRRGGIESFVFALCGQLNPEQVVVFTAAMPGAADFDAGLAFEVVRDQSRILLPTPRVARRAQDVLQT